MPLLRGILVTAADCRSELFSLRETFVASAGRFRYMRWLSSQLIASATSELLPQLVAAALRWVLVCLRHETLVASAMGSMPQLVAFATCDLFPSLRRRRYIHLSSRQV